MNTKAKRPETKVVKSDMFLSDNIASGYGHQGVLKRITYYLQFNNQTANISRLISNH